MHRMLQFTGAITAVLLMTSCVPNRPNFMATKDSGNLSVEMGDKQCRYESQAAVPMTAWDSPYSVGVQRVDLYSLCMESKGFAKVQ
ncbi:MAG: hypothetical protein WAS21_27980 [Geminicoccaceae bacterium]